ncbi:solute carrier family 2, facilitated glucose transporter member 7-like [Anopheles bellator]|uniref:solute carrier family 2, facilitated glucose transporter member 7-like n=1 Tax=Anopheles bellator TaxID=139047 RepID=UPI00264A30AF|nr:solute carrier family 2, facilitated glucose transporter member 7-like [Anopheles bellator]
MSGLGTQLSCILSSVLLLFCGGMHIGWSIMHFYMSGNSWAVGISVDEYRFAILSFFTGCGFIILIVAATKQFLPTRIWLVLSAFFFIINGTFFTAMPTYYAATVATRIIAGFGHGICHVVSIIYVGEIASRNLRGKLVAVLVSSIIGGIALFTILSMVTTNPIFFAEPNMHANRAIGIVILSLSTFALVPAWFVVIESPIHILTTSGNESEARSNLIKLRGLSMESPSLMDEFEDMKTLASESESLSPFFLSQGNFPPFQLTLLIKLANLLFFNYSMNTAKMSLMSLMFTLTLFSYNWAPSILMLSKFAGSILAIFIIDVLPRRFQYGISSTFTGTFMLALGIILATYDSVETWIPPFLYITAEVFNTFGMLPVSEIMLSEAFPPKKRALSVSSVLICEYVGHMVVYIIYFNVPSTIENTYIKTLVFSGVILLKCIIAVLTTPDTRNKYPREAVHAYMHKKK